MTIEDRPVNSNFDPKDYLIPGVLFVAGITIYMLGALLFKGVPGMVAMAVVIPIQTAVQVVLGIIACFITARLMGANFAWASSTRACTQRARSGPGGRARISSASRAMASSARAFASGPRRDRNRSKALVVR